MHLILLGLSIALVLWTVRYRRRATSLPYPPTPPGQFLLGNLRDITAPKQRFHYNELAKQYGEVVHLSALGNHIVVVNTEEAAYELFTKRSAIYSDRPQTPMVGLMGWDINIGMMPYGDRWRAHRRLFQQGLNPTTVASFRPVQSEKLNRYLQRLLVTPQDFKAHADMLIGSIVFKVVYGHEIDEDGDSEDELFLKAVKATANLTDAVLPGSWLVNSLPILRHLPEWMPGCRFQSFARDTKELVDATVDEPYNRAKERSDSGNQTVVAILEESLASGNHKNMTPRAPTEVCGAAFGAAGETTLTVIGAFYLIMRQHPEVQDKAYHEIGEVIGRERLPDFDDRNSLPYVEAVYRELMRWMPAVPYCVPHCTSQDDVYKGYYIPKGTTVLGNIWNMMNDETKYPEPRKFMPERFLTPEGKFNGGDINAITSFGFGRRICVGRYFADATVWRLIACVLAAFHIGKPKDRENDEIEKLESLDEAFLHSFIAHSIPYSCDIKPRTPEIAEIIRESSESIFS